jgi:hypothetical protein
MLGSIVVFIIISLGLGFLVDLIISKWNAPFLEKLVIRFGSGILMVSVLGVLFNHLRIPLHWLLFTAAAVLIAGITIRKRKNILLHDVKEFTSSAKKLKLTKSFIYQVLGIVLLIISMNMYIGGSFNYPWLEDGDPYGYAMQSKYIAEKMTYESPEAYEHYSAPYTQGYQIFMGILHQTNDSIYWNMKFFNALVISLSVIFFYYFMRRVSGRHDVAFWGTLVLTAIPAWLSHFIFSLNYNMALMPIYFYAVFSIDKSKKWSLVAGIFLGSLWINHFYTAVIITGLTACIIFSRFFQQYPLKDHMKTIAIGLLLWLVFQIPTLYKHRFSFYGGAHVGGLTYAVDIIRPVFENPMLALIPLALLALCFAAYYTSSKWSRYLNKLLEKPFRRKVLYVFS